MLYNISLHTDVPLMPKWHKYIPSSAFLSKSSRRIFWCSSPSWKLYRAHFFNSVSPSPHTSISSKPGNHSSIRESMWSTTCPRRMHPWRNQKRKTTFAICHSCNHKAKLYIPKAKAQQTKCQAALKPEQKSGSGIINLFCKTVL